jgi:hypothetical protein
MNRLDDHGRRVNHPADATPPASASLRQHADYLRSTENAPPPLR